MVGLRPAVRRLDAECLQVEVVDVLLGIALEEGFLVDEAEGEGLKALVKQLHVLLAHLRISCFCVLVTFPVEDVPCVVNLVVLHFLSVRPHSGLDEPDLGLLVQFVLDLKPNVALVVDLVDEFDQRARLEQFVAHLVFDVGEEVEEVVSVYFWVAEDVPEDVSERGLGLQQRLKGNLVDLFEAVAVDIGKVLNLQLPDEVLVGGGQVHLPECPVGVDVELLDDEFVVEDLLPQVLVDEVVFGEDVEDHFFLLLHGALDAEDGVELVDVEVDGVGVVEWVEVEVELVGAYVLLGVLELEVEELDELLGVGDDFGVLDLAAEDEPVEHFLHLFLEVVLLLDLQVAVLEGPLLLEVGRDHGRQLGRSDRVLPLALHVRRLQLLRADLPVLHYLLHYLAAADAPLRSFAQRSVFSIVELEILDPPEYFLVQLFFDDFPSDDCIGLEGLVLVELFVDFIDFSCLYLVLLFLEHLGIDFFLDFVDGLAHREVDLPEDALDERAYHSHQHEMHDDEEDYYGCVVLWAAPAVVVDDGRPACLCQHLHQQILRVYVGLEVRELNVLVVAGVIEH